MEDAYLVGVLIEELDIDDLEKALPAGEEDRHQERLHEPIGGFDQALGGFRVAAVN